MFNKERFHNELAMRLGYERIVKDKRILISVDDADAPWVTLKVQGHEEIRFNAAVNADEIALPSWSEMQTEIKYIIEAAHQAYLITKNSRF